MKDKNLSLKNIIANQALEGQHMTEDEISRSKAVLESRISPNKAINEIHRELESEQNFSRKVVNDISR